MQVCTTLDIPFAEEWLSSFVSAVRVEWLTPLVHGITFLGEAEFFVLFFVIAFARGKRFNFYHLGFLLLASALLNQWVKDLVQACRPWSVTHLIHIEPGDLSFPSGHAQISASFWGYLALVVKQRRWKLSALVLLLLIALSRPYLGVHYFHDIVAGVLLGGPLAYVFFRWADSIELWLKSWFHAALILASTLVVCILIPTQSFFAFQYWGALAGLVLGFFYKDSFRQAPSPLSPQWVPLAIAIVGTLVFYVGFEKIFDFLGVDLAVAYASRFFLVTAWLTIGARLLSAKLGKSKS